MHREFLQLPISPGKKAYFCSDQHFGAPTPEASLPREKMFLQWLDDISADCQYLFLMGDLFDFWHDWKYVVPRGYIRLLGKLALMHDAGVQIFYFVGNHDLWAKDYFQKEIGAEVFRSKQFFQIGQKRFLLAHGDGLGPGDKGYKRLKKLFTNPLAQWGFRWLHPDLALRLATYLSTRNKMISGEEDVHFLGEEKEYLIQYSYRKIKEQPLDYLIFGHRHLPMVLPLRGSTASYVNLGDWISYFTFGEFDGENFSLMAYDSEYGGKPFIKN